MRPPPRPISPYEAPPDSVDEESEDQAIVHKPPTLLSPQTRRGLQEKKIRYEGQTDDEEE